MRASQTLVRRIGLASIVVAVAGCSNSDPFEQDVSVSLSPATQMVSSGQDATVAFDARGTALVGVIIDFGDAVVDSLELFGATDASGLRAHAYATTGSFVIAVTAVDAVAGTAVDSASVTVVP